MDERASSRNGVLPGLRCPSKARLEGREAMSRKSIAIVGAVLALGALLTILIKPWESSATIGSLLDSLRFNALSPPSTLTPPGTVVAVISDNPLALRIVGDAEGALGPGADDLTETSESPSLEIRERLSGRLTVRSKLMIDRETR